MLILIWNSVTFVFVTFRYLKNVTLFTKIIPIKLL